MTPALTLALLGYVVVMAVLGPRLLRACHRAQTRAPRFGLALWITTISAWVVAVLSGGLAAIAQLTDGHGLAALLRACLRALAVLVAPHDPAEAAASIAFLGSALFAGRLAIVAIRHARRTRLHRRRHHRELFSSDDSGPHDQAGVTVVDCAAPTAYCVPGPHHTIVVTTGTLRRLTPDQLHAVLAHESSHLAGRHHLWLGWATVLAQAFGFVPLLRTAPGEVARLVEWIADDRAAVRHGDRTVARALAAMATTPTGSGAFRPSPAAAPREPNDQRPGSPTAAPPDVALTAATSGVPERMRRLLNRQPVAGFPYGRAAAMSTVCLLALVTAAAVLIPAATADPRPLCTAPPSLGQLWH